MIRFYLAFAYGELDDTHWAVSHFAEREVAWHGF